MFSTALLACPPVPGNSASTQKVLGIFNHYSTPKQQQKRYMFKVPLKTIYYQLGPTPDAVRHWLNYHKIPYEVVHNRILVSYSDLEGYKPRRTYGSKPTGVQEAVDDLERKEAIHERKQRNQWVYVQSLDALLEKGYQI